MGRFIHKLVAVCICATVFLTLCYIPSIADFPYAMQNVFSNAGGKGASKNEISCYDQEGVNLLETISNSPPVKEKRIFFIESSCESSYKGDIVLSPRQACAVESAAKVNPNSEVTLLFASPIPLEDPSHSRNDMVHALLSYPNVRLKHVNVADYVKGTKLKKLYQRGALKKSSYPVSHASDILRYLTLWKYGGTYLDLDVVVMKSVENISNFVGAESLWAVAAGVVNFEVSGLGHEIASDCVDELQQNFKMHQWGSNGPGVITRVLKKYCKTKEVYLMVEEQCSGFKVMVPSAFYPVPWPKWYQYFNENDRNSTLKQVEKSYAIHVWNKHSTDEPIRVGSDQPYGVIASLYCPEVYSSCGPEF